LKYPRPRATLENKNSLEPEIEPQGSMDQLRSSDDDFGWAQIPYGRNWDAERIENLINRKVRRIYMIRING
jgi:hypothetical protein